MKKQSEIDHHYNEAVRLALIEVERLARVALKKRRSLNEFVMCMGSWHFTTKKGDIADDSEAWADEISEFMSEWDEYLKLTGQPMRFTADGPVRRDW